MIRSFKMSTTGAGLAGVLIDPVSTVVASAVSKNEGSALVTLIIVGTSWNRSVLLYKVTIEASDIEVRAESWVVTASSVGRVTRISST